MLTVCGKVVGVMGRCVCHTTLIFRFTIYHRRPLYPPCLPHNYENTLKTALALYKRLACLHAFSNWCESTIKTFARLKSYYPPPDMDDGGTLNTRRNETHNNMQHDMYMLYMHNMYMHMYRTCPCTCHVHVHA